MGIEKISRFWPDWQLKEILGQGAFGKVYRAEKNDSMLYSEAAIKVISVPQSEAELAGLRSEGMDESSSKSYLHGIVEDFVNEIKVMESLKGVTNIVSVEDFKVVANDSRIGWDIFIRMELLTPFSKCMEKGNLAESEIIKLGVDLCTALEVCSKLNIIHRDIKPANIFISKMGDYKLGDFGVAKKLEATSSAMSAKGTQSYIAPEVLHGGGYDATVDIYSLALVMYRLLNNNKHPFLDPNSTAMSYRERQDANDRRLAGEALPPPCNASKELASIILTACNYDPKKRFRTPTEFKNALLSYANGTAIHTLSDDNKNDNEKDEHSNNTKKKGFIAAIIILLLLIAGSAAAVFGLGLLDKNNKNTDTEAKEATSVETTNESTSDTLATPEPEPIPEPFDEALIEGIWYTEVTIDQFEKLTGSSVNANLSRFTGIDTNADISDYPPVTFIFEFFAEEKKTVSYYAQDSLEAYLTRYSQDVVTYFYDPEVLAHLMDLSVDDFYNLLEAEGLTLEEYAKSMVTDYTENFDAESMARDLSNELKRDAYTYETSESGLTVYAETVLEMIYEDGHLHCVQNGVDMLLSKDTEGIYERSVLTMPEHEQFMGYWYAPITYESALTLCEMDPYTFSTFTLTELGLENYSWPEAELYCDGDSHAEIRINGYELKTAAFTYLAAYYDRMSIISVAASKMGTTEETLNQAAQANGHETWEEYIMEMAASARTAVATLEESECHDIVYDDYFYRTTNSDIIYMTDNEYTESFRFDMGDLTLIYSNSSSRLSELCGDAVIFEFYSNDTPKY